jgi:signal transduction histidine kinase
VAAQLRLSPRHQLRVETALAELIGEWDGVRLRRVLDNLLSNAIKYSPAGGPVLVTVAREQIDGGAYAVLAVQDHGVGIPAADLSHIFERFHRASNVQGRISGTGIGLASARQIVEQHGGDLTVRSTEGQGSVFTVLLPLAPTPG